MRWLWVALALVALLGLGWWLGRSSSSTVSLPPAPSPMPLHASPSPTASPAALVAPPRRESRSQALVRAGWGAGPGQLGKKGGTESAPEGPMSLTVDGKGTLYVLDEVNRRVQRWSNRGALLSPIPVGGDTAQDLALGRGGQVALLDRLGEKNLQLFAPDGSPLGDVNLAGKGVPEAGGITGLFSDRDGNFWVEREHSQLVRIALADGHSDADRPTAPGRPSRDGRQYLAAAIADKAVGTALVRGLDGDGNVLWQEQVSLGAPLLYLSLLDSDGAGNVYLAGHTGRESTEPPYPIVDEKLAIAGLGPEGSPRGLLILAAEPPLTESFRELAIGDDGTIYRMVLAAGGVVIETYHF